MSTSVFVRYTPPLLPAVVSNHATFWPPSSKFSASIVPGTAAGVPLNGVLPPAPGGAVPAVVELRVGPGFVSCAHVLEAMRQEEVVPGCRFDTLNVSGLPGSGLPISMFDATSGGLGVVPK